MERPNSTTLALLGGVGVLLVLLIVFAATRDSDQDKLGDAATYSVDHPDLNAACAGQPIFDQIKRALFSEAQRVRGEDQEAYQRLAATASIRLENAAAEGEGRSPGIIDCSGSMAIDLPPGITTVAGRRLLMTDVNYAVDPQSKRVVQLRSADQIVRELAALKIEPAPPPTPAPPPIEESIVDEPLDPLAPVPDRPDETAIDMPQIRGDEPQ